MSRTLSLTMRAAANAEHTGELLIFLVTISHPTLDQPLRYCSDPTVRLSTDPLKYGLVSRGDTFEYLPMGLTLPTEADEVAPAMTLVLDNVTRQAIPLLRSVTDPASVTVELILKSDLDTVEALWPEFDLINAPYDALQVSLELAVNALTSEPYPAGEFNPAGFGGLF